MFAVNGANIAWPVNDTCNCSYVVVHDYSQVAIANNINCTNYLY